MLDYQRLTHPPGTANISFKWPPLLFGNAPQSCDRGFPLRMNLTRVDTQKIAAVDDCLLISERSATHRFVKKPAKKC
eukprot:s1108_g13.t1